MRLMSLLAKIFAALYFIFGVAIVAVGVYRCFSTMSFGIILDSLLVQGAVGVISILIGLGFIRNWVASYITVVILYLAIICCEVADKIEVLSFVDFDLNKVSLSFSVLLWSSAFFIPQVIYIWVIRHNSRVEKKAGAGS